MDVENKTVEPEEAKTKSTQAQLTPKQVQASIIAGEKWLRSGGYKGEESRWKQWEKNKKYLMCVWPDSEDGDVTVNSIFSNYNTSRPHLYFKNPKITVKASKPTFSRDEFGNVEMGENGQPILVDNYKAARLMQTKLNYELREIKFKKTLKKLLGDTLCPYGVGWAKVGYSVMTVGGSNNDRSTKVSIWVERVDPRNLVYHWLATDNDKNQFTAERLIMTRKEAEEYGFQLPDNYTCSLPDFLRDRADAASQGKSDEDLVIAWEFHDHQRKMIYWTLCGQKSGAFDEWLKEPAADPYPFEGSCYVPLVLNENNDDIIGLSDVEPVEDQALAINRIRTKQTKHIEMFGTHVDYEDGALTEADIEKTKVTDHGVYTKIQSGFIGKVQVRTQPSMNGDELRMDALHKEDMRQSLGTTDYMQGGGSEDRTATEGQIIQNAATIRVQERRDIIYDFVIEIVRRVVALLQEFSEGQDYLNLADEELDDDFAELLKQEHGFNPNLPFLHMKKEDIQGEFNFEFNIEDMIARPKEVQLQQWINLMGVIGQNPSLQKAVDEEGVSMRKVVRKVFELAGIDLNEVKSGGPTALTVEQENQMFLKGMEVPEPHPKDKDDEHIIGHDRVIRELQTQIDDAQAQAQSVMMSAQKTASMADPNDPGQAQIAQSAQMKAKKLIDQITEQMEPINNIVRKLKLHNQAHDLSRQKKEMTTYAGGMPQMPQGMPQGAARQQVDMQSQANQVG